MRGAHHGALLQQIERIFRVGTVSGLPEDKLLERVCAQSDESSFEALVLRHGPMVWGVCHRLLWNPHDAEDAFQATFLILLSKIDSLRDPSGVSPWLYGVAYRVALRARGDATRRRKKELEAAQPEAIELDVHGDQDRMSLALDEEIRRLPEKYLKPVILCYLEGLSYEEAARRLNRTPATIKGQLARARERLRSRLTRRGFAPNIGLLGAESFSTSTPAVVPKALAASTIHLLQHASAGGSLAAVASSATVVALVDGVIGTMRVSRWKVAAMSLSVIAGTTLIALACAFAQSGPDKQGSIARQPQGSARPDEARVQDPPDRPETARPGESMEIRVVDKRTRKALPGVALDIAGGNTRTKAASDSSGRYVFAVPDVQRTGIWVRASKEGFVPTWVKWGGIADSVRFTLPQSLELELEPGTTIGGVIQDPQGRPIERALVYLMISDGLGVDGTPRPSLPREPVKTDPQGRWVCNFVPADLDGLQFRLEHPDHVSEQYFHKGPSASALRNRTAMMVMEPGLLVLGKVVDRGGRPIADAQVKWGDSLQENTLRTTRTDAEGRFAFPHVAPGELVLTVRAAGHAPELKRVGVGSRMLPIEFRLGPGQAIVGRVVGPDGEPVADASIGVAEWAEFPNLIAPWTKSAADGGFRIPDEPAEPVTLRAYKPGFMVSERTLRATDGEHLITLAPELTIRGSVVDVETHQPIKDFTLLVGETSKDKPERWVGDLAHHLHNGRYEAIFASSGREVRRLRIEAEGYIPAVSRGFRSTEGRQSFDFKLTRGTLPSDPALSGTVLLPDGTPAAGAIVTLATKSQPVKLTKGRDANPQQHPTVKTGTDGRFAFPHQAEPAVILAYHERGHVRIPAEDFARSHTMTIRPWSRVEGTLKVGPRPGAFQTIALFRGPMLGRDDPRVRDDQDETETDGLGHFALERVIPGEARIGRQITISRGTWSAGPWVPINVAPGATVQVAIGGTGRPVVGRFIQKKDTSPGVDWSAPTITLSFGLKLPRIDVPGNLIGPKRAEWAKVWLQTEAGKAYVQERDRALLGHYPVKVESDGSFRIEDVTAGTYEWTVLPMRSTRQDRRSWSVTPGTTVVPNIPGGRSDKPLELGDVELVAAERSNR